MKKILTILLSFLLFILLTCPSILAQDNKNLHYNSLKNNCIGEWTIIYYMAADVKSKGKWNMDMWAKPLAEYLFSPLRNIITTNAQSIMLQQNMKILGLHKIQIGMNF